jgi:hypothetical protein
MVKEMARLRAESSARASQSKAEASSSVPDAPVALVMLTADEIETMAENEEPVAPADEDEEMVDTRWSNEDDEDRPVAGS